MKRLLYIIPIFLLITSVKAATINPTTWSLQMNPGDYATQYFDISISNETCEKIVDATYSWVEDWIIGFPEKIESTGNLTITNIPITLHVPKDTIQGLYTANVTYCNSTLEISIQVLGLPEQPGQCNLIVTILGSKVRGKSMSFDIRDTQYNPKDATIYITRADGTTERLDCPAGFCSWLVPPTEEGPIIVRTVVAGCSPVTKQIDLAGELAQNQTETEISGGKITITGPTEASLGENFQFLVIAKSQPLQWVNIQIVGPEGYTFSGTTNQYGIVVDSSNKVFGTDIKPDRLGDYTLFASREGYSPAEFHFRLIRKACPYECCEEGEFEPKACPVGYECINNKCEPIKKPKFQIKCNPETPLVYDEITCELTNPDGVRIMDTVQGTLRYGDKEETVIFTDGYTNFTIPTPTKFIVEVPDALGFEGNSYTGQVLAPSIPWKWLIVGFVIFIVVIIIVIVLFRKKGGAEGHEILLESPTPSVEKITHEK